MNKKQKTIATQEADNVLILQRNNDWKWIEVLKNRFDGELGCVPLQFQKKTNTYRELPSSAFEKVLSEEKKANTSVPKEEDKPM